jgi:hypothetical protein
VITFITLTFTLTSNARRIPLPDAFSKRNSYLAAVTQRHPAFLINLKEAKVNKFNSKSIKSYPTTSELIIDIASLIDGWQQAKNSG